jgi:hypothetical protein
VKDEFFTEMLPILDVREGVWLSQKDDTKLFVCVSPYPYVNEPLDGEPTMLGARDENGLIHGDVAELCSNGATRRLRPDSPPVDGGKLRVFGEEKNIPASRCSYDACVDGGRLREFGVRSHASGVGVDA